MKKIIKEEFWVDSDGARHYYRVEKLVSDNEYYTRKYFDAYPQTNLRRIFDSYRDYKESNNWD